MLFLFWMERERVVHNVGDVEEKKIIQLNDSNINFNDFYFKLSLRRNTNYSSITNAIRLALAKISLMCYLSARVRAWDREVSWAENENIKYLKIS